MIICDILTMLICSFW